MHTLVRIVFSKLDPEEEEANLAIETEDEAKEGELRMTVTRVEEVQSLGPVELTEITENTGELSGNFVTSDAHLTGKPSSMCVISH